MVAFRKPVLKVGSYVTRSGEILDATPDRLRGWADKFRRLKAERIRIPLSWGHQSTAEPTEEDDADRREFYRSALNAGHLDGLEFNDQDQTLWANGEAPAAELDKDGNLLAWIQLPDGTKIKSAVGEVSLGINSWRDGQGRQWDDIPIHLALCVLPVAHGLAGFQALSTIAPGAKPHCHCPAGTKAVCTATGCECRPVPSSSFNTKPQFLCLSTALPAKSQIRDLAERLKLGELLWEHGQEARLNRLLLLSGYEEEKHPRDKAGRWAKRGGTATAEEEEEHTPSDLERVFSKAHPLHDRIFYHPREGKYYDRHSDVFLEEHELKKFGLGA